MNSANFPSHAGVLDAGDDSRGRFVRRTYMHLALAIMMFAGMEALIVQKFGRALFELTMQSQWSWLGVLGAYMVVCWLAERWAASATSLTTQYVAMGVYVLAEAVIFAPLMYLAVMKAPMAIPAAAIFTLLIFAALTLVVVVTGKDFSFLRGFIIMGGFAALGFIVASIVFGWHLGVVFAAVMVAFAMMTILFHTSRVMREYAEDQYVAASISLFASLALLFWYVLRIAIAMYSQD